MLWLKKLGLCLHGMFLTQQLNLSKNVASHLDPSCYSHQNSTFETNS